MSLTKKILLALLAALIVMQFFQPARNQGGQASPNDIVKVYKMPDTVKSILQTACYDCHSDNTYYPWYSYVQPAGWILNEHIEDGKKDLNFSEFGSYSARRQQSKLTSIASQVEDGEMPLYSYTIMHKNARLSKEQKALLIHWARNTKDSLDKINPKK